MILHIVPDEKFIDMAYNMFELASPNNNEFMVLTKQEKFTYIKTTPITKIKLFKFLSKDFAKSLDKYEFVILHWLDKNKMRLVLNSANSIKFLWIGWGGDYYNFIKFKKDKLLLPKTKELSKKINSNKKYTIKDAIKQIIKKIVFLNFDTNKAINRINYFAPVLFEDYILLENSITNFKPKYIDWNYGTLEDDLIVGLENIEINNNNILVGNSDTATNNHLEVFDILYNLNIENRQLIIPLSYGNIKYRDEIIKIGKELFKNNFTPIVDFMHISKYNKIISSCSTVIMNHTRQQALGNIVIMMYLGAKIFLNKENPVYDFFINNKAIVFTLDELNNESLNKKLTEDEIEINRQVLRNYWSREVILGKTTNLIETIRRSK